MNEKAMDEKEAMDEEMALNERLTCQLDELVARYVTIAFRHGWVAGILEATDTDGQYCVYWRKPRRGLHIRFGAHEVRSVDTKDRKIWLRSW